MDTTADCNNCSACKQVITTSRMLKCVSCKAVYHPICVNVGNTDLSRISEWQCPLCKASEPKYGNSNTPVRASNLTIVPSATANISSRAQKRIALSSPNRDVNLEEDPVAGELRLLRLDMAEIKSCLVLLRETMDKFNTRLDAFETRIKVLEEKEPVITLLRDTVEQLEDQLNQQTQANLKNELEIIGICETSNENLEHVVMIVATKVGINLPESEIDWVTRVGPKNNKNNRDTNSPRPIIVRLTRKAKRDEFLKAAKVRRHMVLTSADLDIQGPPRNVYVNERLSKNNRLLFRDARLRAKQHGYRYCWINGGRVHVRKDEGKPAILIRSASDMDRFLPSCGASVNAQTIYNNSSITVTQDIH